MRAHVWLRCIIEWLHPLRKARRLYHTALAWDFPERGGERAARGERVVYWLVASNRALGLSGMALLSEVRTVLGQDLDADTNAVLARAVETVLTFEYL